MNSSSSSKREDAEAEQQALEAQYRAYQELDLHLDMTRGKPSLEQLNMVSNLGLDDILADRNYLGEDAMDCRNYGLLNGIREMRQIFAEMLRTVPEQTIVLNNASLTIMYDCFARALLFPLPGCENSWGEAKKVKVLCPSPGYDRHFNIAESFGCELISVPMNADGPDMDQVESLLRADPAIKAMFVVPVYSNPDGFVFSREVCERMASMQAAPDFRIFWDNAYSVHNLYPDQAAPIYDILAMAAAAGNPDRFFDFASTSKMTYAGAGISCLASSLANIDWFNQSLKYQTIGPDKINQLKHARFFAKNGGIKAIMAKHAELLRPKFELVLSKLEEAFPDRKLVQWHLPKGGYFISINLNEGMAKAVVKTAKEAGVALTPAGAAFPYGKDPLDQNLRIAPSFPSLKDLAMAMDILILCIRICDLQKRLA